MRYATFAQMQVCLLLIWRKSILHQWVFCSVWQDKSFVWFIRTKICSRVAEGSSKWNRACYGVDVDKALEYIHFPHAIGKLIFFQPLIVFYLFYLCIPGRLKSKKWRNFLYKKSNCRRQNETSIRGPLCLQYRRYLSVMRLSIAMPRRSDI